MENRRSSFALALTGLLLVGASARGELCSIDAVPAATLLLPGFEINLRTLGGSAGTTPIPFFGPMTLGGQEFEERASNCGPAPGNGS